MRTDYDIPLHSGVLSAGRKTLIMGVINVTPDSFSDGGDFFACDHAVRQGVRLYEEGADILDIGGESTRPFSKGVSAAAEARRVVPVIQALAQKVPIPISVDTTKAEVARQALDAGAAMINDISALRFDPEMAALAAASRVPLILMHMKGTPGDMQVSPTYDDVIGEILQFLADAMASAQSHGVDRSALIVDPGIGFGKTAAHNLTILKHLDRFGELDAPLLVGTSRKAFIRSILAPDPECPLDPKSLAVETGTQATVAAAAMKGAHIVRVHHVANTRATLEIIDAVGNASG